MKLRRKAANANSSPDPAVNLYEDVFEDNDVLDRKKVSRALSKLVDEIEDPLVIALNGRWGAGKSYFLKRWVGAHRKQNGGAANTVYFDAFAYDYMSDPLTSLVSVISSRIPQADKRKLDRMKTAAYKIARPLARIGLSVATFGAKEALDDLGDAVAEAAGKEVENAAASFWKLEASRHASMVEFGEALQDLLQCSDADEKAPLVVVIDELDRCRPDCALEVLEIIKHFFSVAGVHFVLGVNLAALEKSVEARYGVGVDSEAYLRKFISLQLSLPTKLGEGH